MALLTPIRSLVVSFHHGAASASALVASGQVIVADGTAAAARRLERVLTNDPGMASPSPDAAIRSDRDGAPPPHPAADDRGSRLKTLLVGRARS